MGGGGGSKKKGDKRLPKKREKKPQVLVRTWCGADDWAFYKPKESGNKMTGIRQSGLGPQVLQGERKEDRS